MKKIASALALSLFATPSFAQNGFSMEALIGKAEQDTTVSYPSSSPEAEDDNSFDGDSTSYGLRGAYQFGQYFAVELAYLVPGEYENNYIDEFDDSISEKYDNTSIQFGVKGILPVSDKLSLNARAGLADWDFKISVTDSSMPGESFNAKRDGQDPYYGIGADYQINDAWFVGLSYTLLTMEWSEKYFEDDDFLVNIEHDVSNLSLSLGMKF